jgi:hypothetical protein
MPGSVRKLLNRDISGASQSLIFFTLFYLYIWLCVDLRLMYHGAGVITNFPVFYKGWAFFRTFLSYPGGPLEYLSAFLSQLFYYSGAGALVVTVQAWLLSVSIDYLSKAMNLPRFRLMRFIPPILLLILYTRYAYHFPTTLAFLTALLFVCLYLKMTLSQTAISRYSGTFLSLSVILYYLAGGAFLLFVVLCALYELLFRSRWKMSLFYLLSAVVITYIVGLLILRVSIIDAFCNMLPFSWKILYYESRRRGVTIVYLLYLLPPLTLLASGLWRMFGQRFHFVQSRPNKKPVKKRHKSSKRPAKVLSWFWHSQKLRWGIESLLLLAVAGGAVFLSRDDNLKTRFKVDYYAYHKMWPEVLISARSNPTNPFIAHAVNRALYHTGRLNYDMFSWPQSPDYLFLTNTGYKWVDWQIFDVYLDLGLINIAENALTDCLEGLGDRPMVLKRLALINMVKANYPANGGLKSEPSVSGSARVYLGALSKTLFDADWADYYLARLKSEPDLSEETEIQRLRSLCLQKDFGYTGIPVEKMLLRLLEKNKQNRMAFEYLMAWYMLNKHLGKLALNIERLKDFGYPRLPRHYEEASLIYVYGTGKPLNLSGYEPNPQLRQQIEDFSRLLSSYGADKQAAFKELSKNFRNTYLFYYIYAPSGTKK